MDEETSGKQIFLCFSLKTFMSLSIIEKLLIFIFKVPFNCYCLPGIICWAIS